MNYTILLETAYQNMMNCDISELQYYRNICDNLVALKKQTFVSFEGRSPIHEYVFQECLMAGVSEVEYFDIRVAFDIYMNKGFDKVESLNYAFLEVFGSMDNENPNLK